MIVQGEIKLGGVFTLSHSIQYVTEKLLQNFRQDKVHLAGAKSHSNARPETLFWHYSEIQRTKNEKHEQAKKTCLLFLVKQNAKK